MSGTTLDICVIGCGGSPKGELSGRRWHRRSSAALFTIRCGLFS
jgi:hypothetical protein